MAEEEPGKTACQEWRPSLLGRMRTFSPSWVLRLRDGILEFERSGDAPYQVSLNPDTLPQVRLGLFHAVVTLPRAGSRDVKLLGLPRKQGKVLKSAVDDWIRVAADRLLLEDLYRDLRAWSAHMPARWGEGHEHDPLYELWFTTDSQERLTAHRPQLPASPRELLDILDRPDVTRGVSFERSDFAALLELHEEECPLRWQGRNLTIVERDMRHWRGFLDSIEAKPLTDEQACAVVCCDSRVLVVAAAGSGKTSTMIAKAAFAIRKGYARPGRTLLMAYNKLAAEELQERLERGFARVGMSTGGMEVRTFHALGLQIIGEITGRKPSVPNWAVEDRAMIRKHVEIIGGLRDQSPDYRYRWDMFRIVYGRALSVSGTEPEGDRQDRSGRAYFVSHDGTVVKSEEERMICDWLFLHGVTYQYERRYEHDTVTSRHGQYRPDFYYPDADLYHEHFALDRDGNAPRHFENYEEGVSWKRKLHMERGTDLVETTSYTLRSGQAFTGLAEALTSRGIVLAFDPERKPGMFAPKPMESRELIQLMRVFMTHMKNNSLTTTEIRAKMMLRPEEDRHRDELFLSIFEPVLNGWNQALKEEEGIDFEDMLNLAADLVERSYPPERLTSSAPYDLVMADEFQDSSRARARLCKALVAPRGGRFFAVGDDWQSINRFAGADISVMTGFHAYMGAGHTLSLEQTFRFPQALCDISSRFIRKNEAQISKEVRSQTPALGPVIQSFALRDTTEKQAIQSFLETLSADLTSGKVPPGRDGRLSVFILGRYNRNGDAVDPNWTRRFRDSIDIKFLTVHRSKGAEADYVIIPGMNHGGFPNKRQEDPVLAMAMPSADSYPLSEERRLFYVAMTRARRGVILLQAGSRPSPFLNEVSQLGAPATAFFDIKPHRAVPRACPVCGRGHLVGRLGPAGAFIACSSFPSCGYRLDPGASPSRPGSERTPSPSATAVSSDTSAMVQTAGSKVAQPLAIDNRPRGMGNSLSGQPVASSPTRIVLDVLYQDYMRRFSTMEADVSLTHDVQPSHMTKDAQEASVPQFRDDEIPF